MSLRSFVVSRGVAPVILAIVAIAPATITQTNPFTLPNPNPNLDRFPQPIPSPQPLPPSDQQPTLPTPTPSTPTPEQSAPASIPVRKIEVTGSTILKPDDITPITKPIEGRSVALEELRTVADAITQLYLNRGFITSRAVLVDQAIVDGVVQIRVVEGSLERIDIEGTQRLNPSYLTM